MIVTMTSCAPVVAFKMPGMKPATAPPAAPARITSGQVEHDGQVHGETDISGRQGPGR